MTTRTMSRLSRRIRAVFSSLIIGCLAATLVGAGPQATAQQVIGGHTYPSVTVDLSVLDELGRAPNLPQLYQQQARPYPYNYNVQPRFPTVTGSDSFAPAPRIVLKPPKPVRQSAPRTPRKKITPPPPRRTETRTVRRTSPEKPRATPKAKAPQPTRQEKRRVSPPPKPVVRTPIPVTPPPAIAPPPPPPAIASLPPRAPSKAVIPPPPPPPAAAPVTPKAKKPAPPVVRKTVTRPPPQPSKVAALPKGEARVKSGSMRRIQFPAGSAKLNSGATTELSSIATAMANDKALRIQLLAYAGRAGDSASQARRLSLSRALAARSKLIEKGIRSTRIDVRALGNKSAGGPEDRVDIIVTKR